jgi:hypothetical protein
MSRQYQNGAKSGRTYAKIEQERLRVCYSIAEVNFAAHCTCTRPAACDSFVTKSGYLVARPSRKGRGEKTVRDSGHTAGEPLKRVYRKHSTAFSSGKTSKESFMGRGTMSSSLGRVCPRRGAITLKHLRKLGKTDSSISVVELGVNVS